MATTDGNKEEEEYFTGHGGLEWTHQIWLKAKFAFIYYLKIGVDGGEPSLHFLVFVGSQTGHQ